MAEVGGAVSAPGQFSDAKSEWVAQLIRTLDALALWVPTRDAVIKAGYVDRLLRIVATQLNIRALLLTACLHALTSILEGADPLLLKKITYGLGGVVPLMQYITGRKYEQLAELCAEVEDEGNAVVPLRMLRNKDMMGAIGAVVAVVKAYCVRANNGDADAMECCNKLDAAGREQALFAALEVPDDELKVLVMQCLLEVPVSNLQAEEVQNIVNIIANCDNLTVGRTEEIIGYTFTILKKLVLDDGEEGAQFRRFHAATVHMALDVLVRNSARDTRDQRQESEEKAELSQARAWEDRARGAHSPPSRPRRAPQPRQRRPHPARAQAAVSFLRASSFEWTEAIELMQTRDAVEAMMVIMKNEETFGRPDIPVWVERTTVGSSVQVCQRA